METLNSTLVERVKAFVQTSDEPPRWGSPLHTTTPTPMAIQQLAAQLAAAEGALVGIALDVQALAIQVQALAAQVAAASGDA